MVPSPAETALIAALKELLGNIYVMYFRAHGAHWNVEGPLFVSLHEFFGELAADVYGSADVIAEAIRQHDAYAPFNLSHVVKLATIPDAVMTFENGGAPTALLQDLFNVNELMRGSLKKAFRAANQAEDDGLANFIQDRMAAHQKWMWQLRAHTLPPAK